MLHDLDLQPARPDPFADLCEAFVALGQAETSGGQIPLWTPHEGPQREFYESDCEEVLYGGAAGGGKLARTCERVATPTGWTTMGALRVGDVVLCAEGKPTRVTWVSEVETNAEAWELTFDDGTSLITCADHQWLTTTVSDRDAALKRTSEYRVARKASRQREHERRAAVRAATPGKCGMRGKSKRPDLSAVNAARAYNHKAPPSRWGFVRTTKEIVETLRVGRARRVNHAISNPLPLQLPRADLLVDPYVLGAWLGDGSSRDGRLTGIDSEIWECIERAGFQVKHLKDPKEHVIIGIRPLLNQLGLVIARRASKGTPNKKHIPQVYLRASVEQRVALLQGLCDTDGHATEKGSIEFTTTSKAIRDGMVELLATLGIKPSVREGRAMLRGRDISAKWRIQFWTDLPCFRIARKLARQQREGFRGCHDRRYIVAAKRVPSEPMRCIAVDAPTRSYLLGDRMIVTHNTAAAVALPVPWVNHPDLRVLVLRRRSVDLDDLIDKAKKILRDGDASSPRPYRPACPGATFIASPAHTAHLPKGGRIRFDHCQNVDDWEKYQGQEYAIIVFEELTQFLEKQYLEVKSRLRSSSPGLPRKIRATTNPGGRGAEWVFRRWRFWLDPEATIPGRAPRISADGKKLPPAAPGEVLWIKRGLDGEEIVTDPGDPEASSRTFIPARLRDNPTLLATDPNYAVRLRDNDPIRAKQLEEGDWLAKPAAGLYFKSEWVGDEMVDAPSDIVWARAWDLAASEPTVTYPDPDWTVGVKLGTSRSTGLIYFGGAERVQTGPGGVRALVKATAAVDGVAVPIVLPQDPGQAGKDQAAGYIADLRGYRVVSRPVSGSKLVRFGPFSTQASPRSTGGVLGRVRIVKGAKNVMAWLAVLEAFDGLEKEHDDDADATSDAFNFLQTAREVPRGVGTRSIGIY